jgi:thiosulfate reductase cytochrome b subunit
MLEFLGFALFVVLLFTCVHILMGALADKPASRTRDTIQYR